MASCSGDPRFRSATGSSAPPFLVIPWEPGSRKRFGRRPALAHFANGTFCPLVTRREGRPGPMRTRRGLAWVGRAGLRDPTVQAGRVPPGPGGICRRGSSAPGCRRRSSASPGGGCENLATVPAQLLALAPPRPQGAPPPAGAPPRPRPRPPTARPRPGPRPSADAPLAGSAPRACPSGPRGLRAAAWSLVPYRRSGTRLPRPLGNRLQGDRAPPPAPTPVWSPPVRASAGSQCPLPHVLPRPGPGFVRLGR